MRQRKKRRLQDGRKLAYSMNHNMSTKNLIHLQAGGRTGPLLLRDRILFRLRWETPVRFHGLPRPLRVSLENAARFPSFAPLTGFEPMLVKQKREGHRLLAFELKGGSSGVRTLGLGIKSPLLCQLS